MLVPSFRVRVQEVSLVMTALTFAGLLTVLTGWGFVRRRSATGMLLACDALRQPGREARRGIENDE